MTISPEEVGYWYFRLNGFLTIPNFVLHPDEAGHQKTDIDIVGVRFPHRAELLQDPMPDDMIFAAIEDKPFVALVEIKRGRCEINHSLRRSEERNIHRLLRAVGIFPTNVVNEVADAVYETGGHNSDAYHLALCCLGDSQNEDLKERYPEVKQILWDNVFSFIHNRFKQYRSRKYDHPQWDRTGKFLWNASAASRNVDEFADFVQKLWGITENV